MTIPTPTRQLGLPFDAGVMQTWTDADGDLELAVTLTSRGTRLCLVGPWPREGNETDGLPPVRGVLWQAEVDLVDPRRTRVAPAPEGSARSMGFPHDGPVPDCFSAPLAWAARVGLRDEARQDGVDRLLMAMRRSLVLVARHLGQVLDRVQSQPRPEQCCLWAKAV